MARYRTHTQKMKCRWWQWNVGDDIEAGKGATFNMQDTLAKRVWEAIHEDLVNNIIYLRSALLCVKKLIRCRNVDSMERCKSKQKYTSWWNMRKRRQHQQKTGRQVLKTSGKTKYLANYEHGHSSMVVQPQWCRINQVDDNMKISREFFFVTRLQREWKTLIVTQIQNTQFLLQTSKGLIFVP